MLLSYLSPHLSYAVFHSNLDPPLELWRILFTSIAIIVFHAEKIFKNQPFDNINPIYQTRVIVILHLQDIEKYIHFKKLVLVDNYKILQPQLAINQTTMNLKRSIIFRYKYFLIMMHYQKNIVFCETLNCWNFHTSA